MPPPNVPPPSHLFHLPMDSGQTSNEAEDNAFYAELTRQILLLTDEDDEVQVENKCVRPFNQRLVGGGAWSLVRGDSFTWWDGGEVPVPGWMERLWVANGGGTGVFIPRGGAYRSRRRHKKPKKSNDRGIAHPTPGHNNLG